MKGFWQWFKSKNKMKRWMLIIIVGIILACYGLSELLVMKEISFEEVIKIAVIFIIGFIAIVIGLIGLNKRTLEVLIEATDERMQNGENININSLIFNKTVYDKGPKIVVIGGGTGINSILQGLKQYTSNLTAVVTTSDYGEKKEINELEQKELMELKNSIVALSANEEQMKKLLNYEFNNGYLKGVCFADIYFGIMKEMNNGINGTIIKNNDIFNIKGKVLPVTLDKMNIVAELDNGYIVNEKSRIQEVVDEKLTKIDRVYLKPSNCKATEGVIKAIQEADCIVIGPRKFIYKYNSKFIN